MLISKGNKTDLVEQILFDKNHHHSKRIIKMSDILFRPQYFSSLPSAAMPPLCGVRAIYILAMCISGSIFDFHWPPMLEIGRWTWNVLTWVVWAPCTQGVVAGDSQCWQGTYPTDGISIWFWFRSGFGVLWFGVCSADRGAGLHKSWPLHCRGVCENSLWSMGYVLSAADSGRVSCSVGISLVGRAPELWNLCMYVNPHDQNIYIFFSIPVVRLLYYVISCWQ